MKISDLLNEEQQRTVFEELKEKFGEQPPTQEEIDRQAREYATEAAKLRNSRGAINNPSPGKLG